MRLRITGFIMILITVALAFSVPGKIAFQGRLNNDSGIPIEGTYFVEFALYAEETGGTSLWSETQSVEFDAGLFHVQLGSVIPISSSIFTGDALYLEIIVDGDVIRPRKPFTSVPYAFSSGTTEAGDSDWELSGTDMYNLNDGNVIIGATTSEITNRLEVHGTGEPTEKAVVGISTIGTEGWLGTENYGAYGQYDADNYGALGSSGIGIYAHGDPHAAYLEGEAEVTGDLTIGGDTYVSAGNKLYVDGDPGSEDILMANASGELYWADGSGATGDDWGTQVVETEIRLDGDGTSTSPLDIAAMGATSGQILQFDGTDWVPSTVDLDGDDWGAQVAAVEPRLDGDGTATSPLDIADMGATSGQALLFDGAEWAPGDVLADGDDWGAQVVQTESRLTGDGTATTPLDLADMGASSGQVLKWSGTEWEPAEDETGGDDWGSQVVQSSARFTGDGTATSLLELASMGASDGQVLTWNNTESRWEPRDGGATTDNYLTAASFETADGVLTLSRGSLDAIDVDLDGRYVESGGDNAWTDAGDYIYPNNAPTLHIEDDGDIYLNGHNLEGVDEISANSIDPVLKIDGQLYRTWTTDQVGQKTVVEAVYQLDEHGYFSIDLSQQPKASDLWLFFRSIVPETIIPFVTPHSPDHLYARMEGTKLIVGSTDQRGGTKFSLRLSGTRYDFRGMTQEETNIRTKHTDTYIDIDGEAHYMDKD